MNTPAPSNQPTLPTGLNTRNATADDMAFVYKYWLDTHKPQVYDIPRNLYRPLYGRLLKRIVERDPVTVKVAYFENRPSQLAGFAVTEGNYLHYVVVKKLFRGVGIGSALLHEAFNGTPFHYTFRPPRQAVPFLKARSGTPAYRYIQGPLPAEQEYVK